MADWLDSDGPRQSFGRGLEHIRLGRHFALASADMVECDARSVAGYANTCSPAMTLKRMVVLILWRFAI